MLYGTTNLSNITGIFGGTLYKMNLDGSGFTLLHAFDDQTEGESVSSILDLNGNFVLPVELISFTAEKRRQTTLLTWKTAQELNSDRFEIQRSVDRVNFTTLGTVASRGNTNSLSTYSFTDSDPLTGVNYYRLKQIDIDGSSTYSKLVSVTFEGNERLVIFPNPASDRLNIRIPQGNKYSMIHVTDASGKLVLQKTISSSSTADLDIRGLPKGVYVLQLIGDDTLEKLFLKE